jgi:formate--tetrahydrofolate ligase
MNSDIDIARAAKSKPIGEIAAGIGIPADAVFNYGPTKAKISMEFIESLKNKKRAS